MESAKLSALAGDVSHLLLSVPMVLSISASLHHLGLVCTQLLHLSLITLSTPGSGGYVVAGRMLSGSEQQGSRRGAVGFGVSPSPSARQNHAGIESSGHRRGPSSV